MPHNNRSGEIGTATAEAVVRYLRATWPSAERTAQYGLHDRGDITGTPGIAWEVKGGKAAETASDGQVDKWLIETERERICARAEVGVLVMKRKGMGVANVGSWWAITRFGQLVPDASAPHVVVRLHLSGLVALLVLAGYGSAPAGPTELPERYSA